MFGDNSNYQAISVREAGRRGGLAVLATHGREHFSKIGKQGQKATDGKIAKWIDYSRKTEGMAVYQWPDGQDHRWLTREYGCFGPRRPDQTSGKPFTLKKGQSIRQRVGILIHKGDVKSGRIAERYQQYIEGKL